MKEGGQVRGISIGACYACGLEVHAVYEMEDVECKNPTGTIHAAPPCETYLRLDPDEYVHQMAKSKGFAEPDLPGDAGLVENLPGDGGVFH